MVTPICPVPNCCSLELLFHLIIHLYLESALEDLTDSLHGGLSALSVKLAFPSVSCVFEKFGA